MRRISIYILSITTLILAFSCASPSEDTPVISAEDNTIVDATRGQAEEDSYILFARKWETDNNVYVDLQLDGSFEGSLDGENEIFGNWSISEDQKQLQLTENQSNEGKGNNFSALYTIVEISASKLEVIDDKEQKWTFVSN